MTLRVLDGADLSGLNSFGVAVRARRLVELTRREDISEAADWLLRDGDGLVLGAGTNVLFRRDFDATVLRVALRGRHRVAQTGSGNEARTLVDIAAGEPWHELVEWTLAQGLSGLENLALIPGSVGAAPVQNIGAYGVELGEVLDSVEALNLEDGRLRRLRAEDCGLGYRSSIFRRTDGKSRWLILSIRLALFQTHRPRLDYADLAREFGQTAQTPSAREIADAVSRIRRRKLPDPKQLGNAGSFFRNPVVDQDFAEMIRAQHPGLRAWPDPDRPDRVKLAAGWLIEACGWKGLRRGDAGVHQDHALVLVNRGQATGADIAGLAAEIQASVLERFNIRLDPEVVIVG